MTNEYIENNKLIAEFMGGTLDKPHSKQFYFLSAGRYYDFEALQYHTSWDWLIPVVQKIESLGYDFSIDNCFVRIWDSGQSDFEMTFSEPTKLGTVNKACIEFIKWYNKNK